MKTYCITYKAADFLKTNMLKGITIQADSMLQAVSQFVIKHPDCEMIGILQNDN